MRRALAWLLLLPVILAGSQVAHVFAYRLVYPSASVRLRMLVETGHGYMDQLPLALGIAGAIALVALLATVADAARGHHPRGLPPWTFALLPPATFALQELLERSLHMGTFAWTAFESPTFLPGVMLQLPFAALAYLIGRLLLRGVTVVGRMIRARRRAPRPRHALAVRAPLPCLAWVPRRGRPCAGGPGAGRAPPLLAR